MFIDEEIWLIDVASYYLRFQETSVGSSGFPSTFYFDEYYEFDEGTYSFYYYAGYYSGSTYGHLEKLLFKVIYSPVFFKTKTICSVLRIS